MDSVSIPQSKVIDISNVRTARNQLMKWGMLMAGIFIVYVIVFPLVPAINKPGPALDIEMMLKHGMKWFAPIYTLGLLVLFYAFWRMLKIVHTLSKEDSEGAKSLRLWILGIGVLCGIILLGLYPITALDVALYVVRARLWTLYGGSPMTALPANYPQDPFIALAGEYGKQPSPYGPLWELIAQIPMQMGLISLSAGIISMKVISLLAYVGMAVLIGWYARQEAQADIVSGATALAFFALNPLVLLEAIGNGHNDMLMMALMTLGLVLWQRKHWAWATLALTCAALIKATGLILIPIFGLAVLVDAPNWRTRILRALGMAGIFLVVAGIAYRLTGPFSEVFSGAEHAMFGRQGFSPPYMLRVVFREIFVKHRNWAMIPIKVAPYLYLLYYVFLCFRLVRGKMTLLEAGFAAFFAQLLLGTAFRIWYPLWLIPFAALNLNSRTYWQTFLFSITAELSILSYYILWRWVLRYWDWGVNGPLKGRWDYWLVMTVLTVPWTFGIPWIGPTLRKWKNRQRFTETLWL